MKAIRFIPLVCLLAFLPPALSQPPKPQPAPQVAREVLGADSLDVKEADIYQLTGVSAKDFPLIGLEVFPAGSLSVQKFLTGDGVVLFVKASKPGLSAVFVDINVPPFVLVKKEITVGGVQPGPVPPNPPEPPLPAGKIDQCVIVRETEAQTPAQARVINDLEVRAACKGRLFPVDKNLEETDSTVKAWVAAVPTGSALPWMFLSDVGGSVVYSGALPADKAAMLTLLRKYAWRAGK